jgi:hypothetical protein
VAFIAEHLKKPTARLQNRNVTAHGGFCQRAAFVGLE